MMAPDPLCGAKSNRHPMGGKGRKFAKDCYKRCQAITKPVIRCNTGDEDGDAYVIDYDQDEGQTIEEDSMGSMTNEAPATKTRPSWCGAGFPHAKCCQCGNNKVVWSLDGSCSSCEGGKVTESKEPDPVGCGAVSTGECADESDCGHWIKVCSLVCEASFL